jgi:hypothetical protein
MATDDVFGGGSLYTVKPVNVYDVTAAGKDSLNAAQELEMQRRQLTAQASQSAADRATQARQNAANRAAQARENQLDRVNAAKENEANRAAEQQMAQKRMQFEQEQSDKEFQRNVSVQQIGMERDTGIAAADDDFNNEMSRLDAEYDKGQQEYDDAVAQGDMARASLIAGKLAEIKRAQDSLAHNVSVVDTAHSLMNFGDGKAQKTLIEEGLSTSADITNNVLGANDIKFNSILDRLRQGNSFSSPDDLSPLGIPEDEVMDPALATQLLEDLNSPEDTWRTFSDVEKTGMNEVDFRKRVRELFYQYAGLPGYAQTIGSTPARIHPSLANPQGSQNGGLLTDAAMGFWERAVREAKMEQQSPGLRELADFAGELSVGDTKNQSGQPDVEGVQSRIFGLFGSLQKASSSTGAEAKKYLDEAAAQMRALVDGGLNTEIFGSIYQAVSTQLGTERFEGSGRTASQMSSSEIATMLYVRNQTEKGLEVDPEAIESLKKTTFASPYHTLSLLHGLKDPKTGKSMLGTIQPGLTYYRTKSGKVMSANKVEEVMLDVMSLLSSNMSGREDIGSIGDYLDDLLDNDPKTAFEAGQKINALAPEFQSIVMGIIKRRKKDFDTLMQKPMETVPQIDLSGFGSGVAGLPGFDQSELDRLTTAANSRYATPAEMKALEDFLLRSKSSLTPGEGGQSLAGASMRQSFLKGLNPKLDAQRSAIEAARQKARKEKARKEEQARKDAAKKMGQIK